jgi:hypothetical protein
MDASLKRKLVGGAVAVAAVAGAGGAIAATKLGSPKEDSQAIVNDAAQQLGVQPSALSDALKKALENRVDAEVAAGNLTKAEGDALKARIASGEVPLFGMPHRGFGHEGFGKLDGAASYLGLTEAQLRTDLDGGKTLAQVAKDRGKSVDGLVTALVADLKQQLDADVTAGRITKAQEDTFLAGARQRITNLVDGKTPAGSLRGFRHFDGGARGFRGEGPPLAPVA